ncbi:hypothetical protein TNCV_4526191 [Trichonephila clavipes]|nr:hypothetical protein TNCV_4526191 [Trichonephila clavipes]
MPPNTLRLHTEVRDVKSAGPKVLWAVAAETTSAGGWRIFLSPPVPCLNCGGGDSVVSPSIVKNFNLSHILWQHSFLSFGNFTELNRTVNCMVLKARLVLQRQAPCHDEFRGPWSDDVRQVALETTTKS